MWPTVVPRQHFLNMLGTIQPLRHHTACTEQWPLLGIPNPTCLLPVFGILLQSQASWTAYVADLSYAHAKPFISASCIPRSQMGLRNYSTPTKFLSSRLSHDHLPTLRLSLWKISYSKLQPNSAAFSRSFHESISLLRYPFSFTFYCNYMLHCTGFAISVKTFPLVKMSGVGHWG